MSKDDKIEILDKTESNGVPFGELKVGDPFKHSKFLYVKMQDENAAYNISTHECEEFKPNDKTIPVKIKIYITKVIV